jgi:glycosyltransferase involved in cell wall biosynthesis
VRVLLIHEFYQQYAGEDAVVESELEMLRRAGVETQLYSRHNDEIRGYSIMRKAACALATIQSPRTKRDLTATIRDFRPDVAYLHNLYPLISPSAYQTLWSHRIPIVQVMHNFRPFCTNGLFYVNGKVCERCLSGNYWPAIRQACVAHGRTVSGVYAAALWWMRRSGGLEKIDAFLCLNSFVQDKLVEAGIPPAKVVVKSNSIDLSGIAPDYCAGDYALYLGRLSSEKGLHTLIGAARLNPHLPIVIAGSGPLEQALRAAAADLPHVRFAGFQSGLAKQNLLRRAKFLVLCSEWYENFPVVMLEAFAAGKPVVASAFGGLPRLIEQGKTGLLFQVGSAADLADRMSFLAANPEHCTWMGRAARRRVEESYSAETASAPVLRIFENVIARRPPGAALSTTCETAIAESAAGES